MTMQLPALTPLSHEPIQLQEITIYHLRPVLRMPFKTSFGVQKERDTILVALKTKSGLVGVGEAPSLTEPMFDHQYIWSDYDVLLRFLIPRIRDFLNGQIDSYTRLEGVFSSIKGHTFSKCGIEAAYWHLVSQQTSQSLKTLWGGQQPRVIAGFSIGGKDVDDVLARAAKAVEVGFKRLKVKIWPGFDIEVISRLREKYPTLMLQVDANCAYHPFNPDHHQALKALDQFNLLLIEQPFSDNDLFDHARFQAEAQLQTPITLDESIKTPDDARRAVELWQMFNVPNKLIINIKPPRIGGYWPGRIIAEFAHQHHIPCWIGGMLELGAGKWMNVILAAHPGCTLPGDHLQPQPYYEQDIAYPLPAIQADGTIQVPTAGAGCEIDWEAVQRLTVNHQTISMA
jgi:O-succinylbenzoate synthase